MRSKQRQGELRAQLKVAGDELRVIQSNLSAARKDIEPLIVAALQAGIPPKDVQELAPLSRETIRTIARIAGLPPATPGGSK